MPLSEHEQKLLDQIERALYQEDPKFATTVRSTDLRSMLRRRLIRAGALFGVGFGLLVAGVVTQQGPVVSVLGFVLMVGALTLALTAWKRMSAPPSLQVVDSGGSPRPARKRQKASGGSSSSGGSFTSRLEERWNRRWDERGR